MKATRRTVLSWLVAAVIAPPRIVDPPTYVHVFRGRSLFDLEKEFMAAWTRWFEEIAADMNSKKICSFMEYLDQLSGTTQ